eukprot:272_1
MPLQMLFHIQFVGFILVLSNSFASFLFFSFCCWTWIIHTIRTCLGPITFPLTVLNFSHHGRMIGTSRNILKYPLLLFDIQSPLFPAYLVSNIQ